MGRRRSGEMPSVAVVRPRTHARVRIGGRAYLLGKCPDGKVSRAQQAEAARLWHRYLADGKAPKVEPQPRSDQQDLPPSHDIYQCP